MDKLEYPSFKSYQLGNKLSTLAMEASALYEAWKDSKIMDEGWTT